MCAHSVHCFYICSVANQNTFGLVLYLLWTCSLLTEADAGHTEFTDEVYENESRYLGGEWKAAEESYTDVVRQIFHWISKGLREGDLGFATQCISSVNAQNCYVFPT